MTRASLTRLVARLVALAFLPASLRAQGMRIPAARLESPTVSVRMNAFNELQAAAYDGRRHPDRPQTSFLADSARAQPALAAALIRLLARENRRIATAPRGSLSDDYLDGLYTTLLVTVARIKDPASASALFPGIATSGTVTDALASFGEAALGGTLSALRGADEHRRFAAVITLGRMVSYRRQNHLGDASTELVARALLEEAEDSTSPAREQAVEGLLPLGYPEIRPAMLRLASADSTRAFQPPGAAVRYGVRDAARAWLAAHPR